MSSMPRKLFQSARPRGARRLVDVQEAVHNMVSIRAPAWGATLVIGGRGDVAVVSIRAPAWGATRSTSRIRRYSGRFNPRARVGRDCIFRSMAGGRAGVSIRAPAWGATVAGALAGFAGAFQSARPRGARQHLLGRAADPADVSIRAPAWGATCPPARCWRGRGGFNPRARVGRDARRPGCAGAGGCFNPRARVGRDAVSCQRSVDHCRFNPRARVGRDSPAPRGRPHGRRFNPRARAGRDVGT